MGAGRQAKDSRTDAIASRIQSDISPPGTVAMNDNNQAADRADLLS